MEHVSSHDSDLCEDHLQHLEDSAEPGSNKRSTESLEKRLQILYYHDKCATDLNEL